LFAEIAVTELARQTRGRQKRVDSSVLEVIKHGFNGFSRITRIGSL